MRDLIYYFYCYLYYLSCFISCFLALFFAGPRASAQQKAPQCFEFAINQNPKRSPSYSSDAVHDGESLVDPSQVWCYWQGPGGETLIFNNDRFQFHEELALLIETDPKSGKKYFTQGVLFQGQRRLVKTVDPGFSPFNIPLSLEKAKQKGMPVSLLFSGGRVSDIKALFNKFRQSSFSLSKGDQVINSATFREQREVGFLHFDQYPVDGYWWPQYEVPLAAGDHSPLGKYDRAQQARTGTNPGLVAQEKRHHASDTPSWRGHCHAWAAGSILYPKQRDPLWDEMIQEVILRSDIFGLLAEMSDCVYFYFYGSRYRDFRDDINDISPDEFHKVLRYYLKDRKEPVIVDVKAGSSVDNHVITGYSSKFDQINNNFYFVKTRLQLHEYSKSRHEKNQPAKKYYRDYNYKLRLDSHGNILEGEWEKYGENPDFLWVPISQRNCSHENPALDERKVEGWLASLPKAERRTDILNWEISRSIDARETLSFQIPKQFVGVDFVFNFKKNSYKYNKNLKVRAVAVSHMYPTAKHKSPYKTEWKVLDPSTKKLRFQVVNAKYIEIKNTSFWSKAKTPTSLVIKSVQYWGAPTEEGDD